MVKRERRHEGSRYDKLQARRLVEVEVGFRRRGPLSRNAANKKILDRICIVESGWATIVKH